MEIEPMTTEALDRMLSEMAAAQSSESSPRDTRAAAGGEVAREDHKMHQLPPRPLTGRTERRSTVEMAMKDKESGQKEQRTPPQQSKHTPPTSLNYAELTKLMEAHNVSGMEKNDHRTVSSSNVESSVANSRQASYENKREGEVFGHDPPGQQM